VINTNVTYFLYWRSCPYDRHDLYLPSVPASLQTLGRGECVAASNQARRKLFLRVTVRYFVFFPPYTLTTQSIVVGGKACDEGAWGEGLGLCNYGGLIDTFFADVEGVA
jgi:hypothetical protein